VDGRFSFPRKSGGSGLPSEHLTGLFFAFRMNLEPQTPEELLDTCLSWPPSRYLGLTREWLASQVAEKGQERVTDWLHDYFYKKLRPSFLDPYRHCVVPEHWKDARRLLEENDRLLISGGNRSGKSYFSAHYVVNLMMEKPGSRIAMFSMTAASSVRDQQPSVFMHLPLEYKHIKKTKTTNINYSQKNGFTDGTFILPNGSQCWFLNYAQQPDILEGFEGDAVVFDELVPWHWVETAEYRLVTRRGSRGTGKMLITATPITGWTPVVNDFVQGAKVLETKPASLLANSPPPVGVKHGRMPYVAECVKENSKVIWFHTEMNPWQSPEEMKRSLAGESTVAIRLRAYGWCEKATGNWFPKFGPDHIVNAEDVPAGGTNYMCTDPAGSRNWSALWMKVMPDGKMYVYREWPDMDTFGEWAIAGDKVEGTMGPAQKPEGRGINEYKETFLELEGDEKIEERFIDPRAGGSAQATKEGGVTLIEMLADEPNEMWFTPAPGLNVDQGVQQINEMLAYNPEEPVTMINEPKLYVSRECGNLIDCLQNVSSAGADKNKWKDFIDVLRYLITSDLSYVDAKTFAATGGGTY